MYPFASSHALDWSVIGEAMQKYGEIMQEDARENERFERQKRLMEHQMKLEEERLQRQREYEEKRREETIRLNREEAARLQEIARKKAEEDRRLAISTGTGFFVSPNGYLVTNNHVIDDTTDYAVRDYKGRFYRTQLVARDQKRDLALLKVAGSFPSLRIAHSDSVSKGQRVFAVGYPQIAIQGNESKVTDGIISSFSGIRNDDDWFQISVPIQGGNSGGPLVTESGIVVGVVVASVNVGKFYAKAGTLPQNVNYAIKSKLVLDFLKAQGVKNISSVSAKAGLETVDSATAMVIAKNGSIDVAYAVSPEQIVIEERASKRRAAEDAQRRKAEELAEKKEQARIAAEEKRKRREEAIADKKRKAEELISEKKRLNDEMNIELRNVAVQKAFPEWQEILSSDIFAAWRSQQSNDISQNLNSPKSSDVINVLKRYQAERSEFSEKYFQQFGKWIADANGCKFLDSKPEPHETITWDGKCEQGRGSGKGELIWFSNGVAAQKSSGMFKDGMLDGIGRIEFIDKGFDEGNFKNGKLEGRGKMSRTSDKSFEYEGDFKENKPDGQGRIVWRDDGSYEGSFKGGKPGSNGKRIYRDGGVDEGQFRDGKLYAQGKRTLANGDILEGYFKDGKLEGQGKYIGKEGASYEGGYRNGKPDGWGKVVLRNGAIYEGRFVDGKKDGPATLTTPDGKKRSMVFVDDRPVQ